MTAPASVRALLAGAIDYAGLFPPATLSMQEAVARYARYLDASDAWALGRFVVPMARVKELVAARRDVSTKGRLWRLSVLLGDDSSSDAARIAAFDGGDSLLIDSAEMKVQGPAAAARGTIRAAVDALPPSVHLFAEIPAGDEVPALVAEVAEAGVSAKIRTGGVTASAFPPVRQLARFLRCCADHGLSFKATAGLHHPWRGQYPLTYEPDAPSATMFGFLNILVAAVVARRGDTEETVMAVLETERPSDLHFTDDDIRWRETRIPCEEVAAAHARFALSFGSCSFEEPVSELQRLALL